MSDPDVLIKAGVWSPQKVKRLLMQSQVYYLDRRVSEVDQALSSIAADPLTLSLLSQSLSSLRNEQQELSSALQTERKSKLESEDTSSAFFCSHSVAVILRSLGVLPSSVPATEYLPYSFSSEMNLPLLKGATFSSEVFLRGTKDDLFGSTEKIVEELYATMVKRSGEEEGSDAEGMGASQRNEKENESGSGLNGNGNQNGNQNGNESRLNGNENQNENQSRLNGNQSRLNENQNQSRLNSGENESSNRWNESQTPGFPQSSTPQSGNSPPSETNQTEAASRAEATPPPTPVSPVSPVSPEGVSVPHRDVASVLSPDDLAYVITQLRLTRPLARASDASLRALLQHMAMYGAQRSAH